MPGLKDGLGKLALAGSYSSAMVRAEELDRVVRACDEQLHLAAARPSPTSYASVPLCVLDAVFSLNARYQATRRVPERYCEHFGLPLWRPRAELPPASQQHTVSGFLANIEPGGVEAFATGVLRNRQRTSTGTASSRPRPPGGSPVPSPSMGSSVCRTSQQPPPAGSSRRRCGPSPVSAAGSR